MDLKRIFRGWVLAILFVAIILVILYKLVNTGQQYKLVNTSQVITQINNSNVKSATLTDTDQTIQITTKGGSNLEASWVGNQGQQLATKMQDAGINYNVKVPKSSSFWTLIFSYLPFLIIFLLFMVFLNQMQGGGSRVMNFGKSKAKLITKDTPKTTFADVAGADEAIEELQEIKEFLQSPGKFQAIGAKIPKGVLLYGPPGTGKTLLARAVAGEAGVPFYSISGSDFVEMFVGVGASRVRDLFEQAKANAPAIVFVDEIDAVGRHRGAGFGGGHDEREQTLNQLLVELDGFDTKGGVIVIAATNRPDILDPALLRPGRFDRQIVVAQPDLAGRKGILRVHARGKPFAADVDLDIIARRTPGFTGADLANVINEGALLTARANQTQIQMAALEEAIDRVTAGPKRKSVLLSEKERKIIAYHEGGHALVGHALPNADPVHKITIIPRGRALGYTAAAPAEDKFLVSRVEMMDQLAMLLGGRTSEELVFHEPTTGAANDIEKASSIARAMVVEYGMSERLGARKFGTGDGEPFLGREMSHARDYSEEIASAIDDEVRRLIESAHDEAWDILVQYRDVLDTLVLQLMEHETLSREQVLEIFAPVHKRPSRGSYTGYGKRLPSDRPPVLTPKELALTAASDGKELGNGQASTAGLPAGSPAGNQSGGFGGASPLGGANPLGGGNPLGGSNPFGGATPMGGGKPFGAPAEPDRPGDGSDADGDGH
ncbi:MAG TPA: ATP-dependent zinc metalloprotease FtsH [Streptosporangiaceae bacterium]|nr:ATP-dependent zinc metalloprotease FtsH [Streptosporangiaceae bacterium]